MVVLLKNVTFLTVIVIAYLVFYAVLIVVGLLTRSGSFQMVQESTGRTVTLKRGFVFPYLFFGPLYPLFKGHISGFFLTLVMEVFNPYSRFGLVFCYMERYEAWLYDQGYRRTDGTEQPIPAPAPQISQSQQAGDTQYMGGSGGYGAYNEVIPPVLGGVVAGDEDSSTVAYAEGCVEGISGMYAGAQLKLPYGESILVGRDGSACNLVIENQAISRRHCEIRYDIYERCYQVTDFSTNGVYLEDGRELSKNTPVKLQPGTVIRLGDTNHVFLLK